MAKLFCLIKNGLPLYKNMQQSVPELFYLQNVFLKNTVRPILAEPNLAEPFGFGSGSVRPKIVPVRFGSAKIEFGRSLMMYCAQAAHSLT